jgi:hypothetical protein
VGIGTQQPGSPSLRHGRMRRMRPSTPAPPAPLGLVPGPCGRAGAGRQRPGWWAADLAARREAFETDARIAHRLLSQQRGAARRRAGHAGLAAAGPTCRQRPPRAAPAGVVPQVLQVLRRDDAPGPGPATRRNARPGCRPKPNRAACSAPCWREPTWRRSGPLPAGARRHASQLRLAHRRPGGHRAGRLAVPAAAGCRPRCGRARAVGHPAWLTAARAPVDATRSHFDFRKRLAADSQPFDVVVVQPLSAADLPWGWMAAVVALRPGHRRAGGLAAHSGVNGAARRNCCAWGRWAASTRWANWPPAWRMNSTSR